MVNGVELLGTGSVSYILREIGYEHGEEQEELPDHSLPSRVMAFFSLRWMLLMLPPTMWYRRLLIRCYISASRLPCMLGI